MILKEKLTDRFNPVGRHVQKTCESVGASCCATLIIFNDRLVKETYNGFNGGKAVNKYSQFFLASVRKSYIGFCFAWTLFHRASQSIDEPVA